MKRRLPYPYHFNFGTSRTQEHIKPSLITSYMDGAHNLPPNKRTCSRKEINALQAKIQYHTARGLLDQTTQEEIIPFNMEE